MSALREVVRSGVQRRRVQTGVIGLVTAMAVTASVLGGSLLVASNAPFDRGFEEQHGAHLSAQFDANSTTTEQLSATADADGVTAASGPFPTATITPSVTPPELGSPIELPSLTVAERADPPSDPVDRVSLVEGRWATADDEIVLADDDLRMPLGEKLTIADAPGSPTVTLVGIARSVSHTADAWVVPDALSALTAPGTETGYQMLYRLAEAGTKDTIAEGRTAIEQLLPDGALAGSQSWLTIKEVAGQETSVYVPFLISFGVLGLVMSVLIVGNVVAGAVTSGTRRIGILKALGFTPPQVVRAYMAQALIPATIGAAIGAVAGNLLALPVLSQAESAYQTVGLSVTWWVTLVVPTGVLGVVAVMAFLSALRAGRLRTVDALAVGRTAAGGRGLRMARLTGRLRTPRSISLGLARPFARPIRAGAMVAAVVFGATAVTFTVGLQASLGKILDATAHESADVMVFPGRMAEDGGVVSNGPGPDPDPAQIDPAKVSDAIDDQAGTLAHYSSATAEATVSGMSGSTEVTAFTGDASWGGYEMISGRWFEQPGEAVVPTPFLTATGTEIGDTVTLNVQGSDVSVRIVGEVFDTNNEGKDVFTDAATLAAASPDLEPRPHHIMVNDGVDVTNYAQSLNDDLEALGVTAEPGGTDQQSTVVETLNALAAMLTLMLVTVAALGVLNGVLLDTRERVQELGIYKALGMVPRQTISMVITSVVVPGVVGAALGVPLGLALHAQVLPAMADTAGLTLPPVVTDVYGPVSLLVLGLGGALIAVAGSLLPAGWAARTRTATALRTE